jgi:hypothetical protein
VSAQYPIERAVSNVAPAQISEDGMEQLVQTITDQIMATMNDGSDSGSV